MSFSAIKPYFRARLSEAGFDNEWRDAFNIENIPETIIDRIYHISFKPFQHKKQDQTCLEYRGTIDVQVFFKGYTEPEAAIDTALESCENIIKKCLKHDKRLTQPEIKNIEAAGFTISPIAESNDNLILLVITFDLLILLEID